MKAGETVHQMSELLKTLEYIMTSFFARGQRAFKLVLKLSKEEEEKGRERERERKRKKKEKNEESGRTVKAGRPG